MIIDRERGQLESEVILAGEFVNWVETYLDLGTPSQQQVGQRLLSWLERQLEHKQNKLKTYDYLQKERLK